MSEDITYCQNISVMYGNLLEISGKDQQEFWTCICWISD